MQSGTVTDILPRLCLELQCAGRYRNRYSVRKYSMESGTGTGTLPGYSMESGTGTLFYNMESDMGTSTLLNY